MKKMFGKKGKKQDKKKEDSKSKKSEDTKKKGGEPVADDESKVKRADQIKICIGFLLLAFVILMVVSFISYFFTWESDQSLSNYGFFEAMFNSDIQVENKAGKIGAMVANFFIRDTFGIASFAIVAMLVVISLRLLKIRKFRIFPFIIKSTVIMLWFSIAFASIFKDSLFMLGGKHGYFMFTGMCNLVGAVGAYSIIIVLALIIVIFCFENSILGIKKILEKIAAFKVKDIKEKLTTDDEEDSLDVKKVDDGGDVGQILPIDHIGDEEPTGFNVGRAAAETDFFIVRRVFDDETHLADVCQRLEPLDIDMAVWQAYRLCTASRVDCDMGDLVTTRVDE